MTRKAILLLLLPLLPVVFCTEGIMFTTVSVHLNTPQPNCKETILEIDGTDHKPSCFLNTDNKNSLFLVFNGTNVADTKKNITLTLIIGTGVATNYTGVLVTDWADPNTVKTGEVTMEPDVPVTTAGPTTTPGPTTPTTKPPTTTTGPTTISTSANPTTPTPKKEAHLQIAYIYMKNEVKNVTKNGSAVAVAVIEGLALIAILVYFGYKTMVAPKKTQTTSLYGYDNNNAPRITIPDSIRMSDIPPPRDQNYAIPPAPRVVPQPQRTQMAQPDLVVPSPTRTTLPPPSENNQNNSQFNDPFASLDSW